MPPQTAAWIIQLLWLVFCAYWLINAFHNKKTVYRPAWLVQRGYLLPLIIFGVIVTHWLPSRRVCPLSLTGQTVGIVLCAAGVVLAIWARKILGKNWSGNPEIKADHELIRSGPYGVVRHPIYTGLLLGIFGSIITLWPTWRGILWLVLSLAFIAVRVRQEEALMTHQFPDGYAAYRKSVRWALLPYII